VHPQTRLLPAAAATDQDLALEVAGAFAPRTPFQASLRNFVMRLLPYLPGTGLMMSFAMRGVREAACAMELPA
jgi:hypothetical protein